MSKCEPTENVSVSVPITLLAITDHFCKEADLAAVRQAHQHHRLSNRFRRLGRWRPQGDERVFAALPDSAHCQHPNPPRPC